MSDKFKKTLDRVSRKPMSPKKIEALTGMDYDKSEQERLMREEYAKAEDDKQKQRIRVRAYRLGVELE